MIPNLLDEKIIRNKNVLDVGCVGQVNKFSKFNIIMNFKPKFYMGIDINEKEVLAANKENMIFCNIEEDDLPDILLAKKEFFDTIILTEVIEHFSNAGKALENMNYLLKKKGNICLTTPNAMSQKWITQVSNTKRANINPDHVMWFDKQTLNSLASRFGFSTTVLSKDLTNVLICVLTKIADGGKRHYE